MMDISVDNVQQLIAALCYEAGWSNAVFDLVTNCLFTGPVRRVVANSWLLCKILTG